MPSHLSFFLTLHFAHYFWGSHIWFFIFSAFSFTCWRHDLVPPIYSPVCNGYTSHVIQINQWGRNCLRLLLGFLMCWRDYCYMQNYQERCGCWRALSLSLHMNVSLIKVVKGEWLMINTYMWPSVYLNGNSSLHYSGKFWWSSPFALHHPLSTLFRPTDFT